MIPLVALATLILLCFFFGCACRFVQSQDDLRQAELDQAPVSAYRRQHSRARLALVASLLVLTAWLCGSVVAIWRGWL